jgi:glycosyltransferase involved in cell wall biosynthesis
LSATVVDHGVLSQCPLEDSTASVVRDRRPEATTRVLHLVDTLNIGGTETQMAQAALRLHSRQHEITVGCLRAEGPLLEVLQQAGIPVVEFRKEKSLLSPNGLRQLLRLAILLRSKKFHALHAHDLWANLLGVPAARLAGTPVIITSRRYLEDLEWHTPWRNRILGMLDRLSTHVVVNSSAVRKILLQAYGVSPEKVRVIYNGVDVERFVRVRRNRKKVLPALVSDSKIVAVVANMYSRVKGHAHLIAAASKVCRVMPATVFLLVGDGQERSRLEQLVRDAALQKNFEFVGHRQDVPELLACCDLSVLPSEAEAMPNALLEAMAAGLPVIATDVGGSAEIIEHGVTGLLVPPCDPDALSAAIIRVLQDPSLAAGLAQAGQESVRIRFSCDHLITEFEQLYQKPLVC